MQARSLRKAFLSLVAAACGLGLVVNVASCATAGSGGSQASDASTDGPLTEQDATTDTGATADTGSPVEECNADTMTDPENCGSCGNKCPSSNTCSCGMCTPPCTGGLSPCCGQCVDVNKDPNNCGTCGNACVPPTGGNPVCGNGACSFTCATDAGTDGGGPLVECGPDSGTPGCFDLSTSASACGACGVVCQGTDTCSEGKCCPAGQGICGGTCTPLNTTTNCGACGVTCGTGAQCTGGKCVGYGTSNPTLPFIDACSLPGHTATLISQVDWTDNGSLLSFPAGFSFSFYGSALTQFWLQNQGAMGMGPDMVAFPFGTPDNYPDCKNMDPTTHYPAAVIFGEASMATGGYGVCYGLVEAGDAGAVADAGDAGAATNQQFAVTWKQVTLGDDPGASLSLSIVLTSGTNTIDFQYQVAGAGDGGLDNYVAGSMATVGLQQGNGATATTQVSCYTTFLPSPTYNILFTP